MPVTSIPYQPATGQLIAAYRPIVFKVQATATGGGVTPPFVICDIYLADVYYKSLIRTAPESIASTYSVFQFDISDALQEYLQADLATINNNNLLKAPHSSAKVFCRFRSSDIDGNGFTAEEATAPVQGTKFTSPVAGTGTQSNSFFAINSALQHEDNQNLALHLASYKQGAWAANAFPLTHRNRYYFCDNDSDHYPMIFTGDCVSTDILLQYRLKGSNSFAQATAQDINTCAPLNWFVSNVNGNRVEVHMTAPMSAGQSVFVEYKKGADPTWTTAGTFTSQDFFFYVNRSDLSGMYFLGVTTFCTPCLSSNRTLSSFTLSGAVVNLAWRGINPFCVVQSFSPAVYVQLEVRDITTETTDYPDNINPISRTVATKGNLYALFYSDTNLLNPVTVNQTGLKIFIFADTFIDYFTNHSQQQIVTTYNVDASGTEVLLGEVHTKDEQYGYSPYPDIWSSTIINRTFYPYPDKKLTGGNTGEKGFTNLQEYNTITNLPTGATKPNDSGDPDYIEPVSDNATCPNGPDISTVTFGYGLSISNISIYARRVLFSDSIILYNTGIYFDTQAGGYSLTYPLVKNRIWTLTVIAKTLDSGNTTGVIKCTVTFVDINGVTQVSVFDVQNNIATPIPAQFQNIVNINISNY
jgi:hypothetical protein